MPAGPDDKDASTRLLRTLMEECLERVETDGLAVIDDVCGRHPEIATDLRRRLKQLFDLGLLGAAPTASEREFPERLGDFRLLRCLGGGGMGVVYLADQESLGRRVALKLVRPEHLYFPGARERFRREAEAVARLKHEGIVAIHAVGEENGLPFFAMEWVEGATLAEVVSDVSSATSRLRGRDLGRAVANRAEADVDESSGAFAGTWSETCVRVARDVARALDHAHRQGVLHRDVKPSNLMITPSGRVLLLDFGLAALGDAEPITKSGSQLGSMAYMAPEQLRGEGEPVDERTDVYALGVTLFELLARRRAYPENDVTLVQMRIVTGEHAPLRGLAPDVPWDVETVCLKAMDPDPERRYASAAEFARDLDNVLELRPIVAARAGPVRRLRSWARRHPTRAVGIALTTLLLLFVPATYLVVQARAAERVRGTLQVALDGVEVMLSRMTDPEIGRLPATVELRLNVLQDAAQLFRRLGVTEDDPVELRLRLERLRVAVAGVLAGVGETDAAFRAYDEAVARLDAIATPKAAEVAAGSLDLRAATHLELGEIELAQRLVVEAIHRWEALLAARGPEDGLVRGLLEANRTLGGVYLATARGEEAIALLESNLDAARRAGDVLAATQLGMLGALRREYGDLGQAEAELQEALERASGQLEAHPDDLALRELVNDVGTGLALVFQRSARLEDAERLMLEMEEHARFLVDRQPDRPTHSDRLARGLLRLAELRIDLGLKPAAEETFLEAARIERALAERFPDHVDFRTNLSSALGSVADLRSGDRPDEARPLYEEAIGLLHTLVVETPERPFLWMNLGLNRQGLGVLLRRSGDLAAGVDVALQSLSDFEQVLTLIPKDEWARAEHLATLRRLLEPLARLERSDTLAEIAERLERWHEGQDSAHIAIAALGVAARLDPELTPALFALLERALESGDISREYLNDPGFDPWRDDPRFVRLREGREGD